jgi:hypothetical protein
MFISTFSSGRSRADLARWAIELMTQWGLPREYGFHLVHWEHDDGCPLNPETNPDHALASQCRCQPDGTLVLHIGTAEERHVAIVRNGIALPCNNGCVVPGRCS